MRRMRRPMRYRRRPTARRQAFGNFASAMQQRDSTNIVISNVEECNMYIPQNATNGTLVRNVNAILTSTQYFANYMGMYDQYKINAVRCAIEMTYCSDQLLSQVNFPSICTSWDRNGINLQSVLLPNTIPAARRYVLPNYNEVASYSSANEKTIYYGSRWGVVRQLDAASMMEKSIYWPTANTRDVLTHSNQYSSWNPQLLISLKTSRTPNAVVNATFSLHWQFDVTLRGLRKVNTDNINTRFQPNANFIGYRTDNAGLAVATIQGGNMVYVQTDTAAIAPANGQTINPELNGANNGLIIPNTGNAGDNPNI